MTVKSRTATEAIEQYSLLQILGVWALAAAPMGVLAWLVYPAAKEGVGINPGLLLWVLMIAGLMWETLLSFGILYVESGSFRIDAIRRHAWRQQPRSPKSGAPDRRLWFWLIAALAAGAVISLVVAGPLTAAWTRLLPFLAERPGYNLQSLLETPGVWRGAWYLLGLWALHALGNYLWGEELLFRGVLLPRMRRVFGRWDWLGNALLFALYHVHKPWVIPSAFLSGIVYSYPGSRFRCSWYGVIVHGVEGLFFLVIILGLVLGSA
ncbi:CPBP family intramembrane glutamic endopeptidase [Salinispira pacifica]